MHDKNGVQLVVGDTVTVTAKVVKLQEIDDYCNCSLETVEPMYPGNSPSTLTLNTKQTEKVESAHT